MGEGRRRARVTGGFVARLLAGEVPPELEDVFRDTSVALFPTHWSQLEARCKRPDWQNPCKHIAAVLYVFADRLDDDPWLLLAWRGRSRDQLLEPVRARAGGANGPQSGSQIAPWWPFADGAVPSTGRALDPTVMLAELAEPPDPPDALLRRLDVLDVAARGTPVADLLSAVYETACGAERSDET